METVYYSLDANRLTMYGLASGGTAPQVRHCACIKKPQAAVTEPGKVLDLSEYRRKLAGEPASAAEEGGQGDSRYEGTSPAVAAGRPATRQRRGFGAALDLCATLAILVMAIVVVTGFLPLL